MSGGEAHPAPTAREWLGSKTVHPRYTISEAGGCGGGGGFCLGVVSSEDSRELGISASAAALPASSLAAAAAPAPTAAGNESSKPVSWNSSAGSRPRITERKPKNRPSTSASEPSTAAMTMAEIEPALAPVTEPLVTPSVSGGASATLDLSREEVSPVVLTSPVCVVPLALGLGLAFLIVSLVFCTSRNLFASPLALASLVGFALVSLAFPGAAGESSASAGLASVGFAFGFCALVGRAFVGFAVGSSSLGTLALFGLALAFALCFGTAVASLVREFCRLPFPRCSATSEIEMTGVVETDAAGDAAAEGWTEGTGLDVETGEGAGELGTGSEGDNETVGSTGS